MDAGVPIKRAGLRHRDGPRQGGRRLRHPHRHPGCRRPPRRHGLQGRRHPRGHHRAPDGHQDHGRLARDHGEGARSRRSRPARRSSTGCSRRSPEPRTELAGHAPRISSVKINPEYIGMVIGKGGETIRSLEADYEVQIDIEEDGTILVYATEGEKGDAAIAAITALTKDPGGRRPVHRQGREDDRLRRVRRAEEGHRRAAARLERRPRPRQPHRGRARARRRASTCSCRRSTRRADGSA